ncbi:AGC/NDR/NDR protein kinase [Pelomyxa schiedti]|nr:AGC/NDR/NDR protein kinase [Pelomyxa schiedti]
MSSHDSRHAMRDAAREPTSRKSPMRPSPVTARRGPPIVASTQAFLPTLGVPYTVESSSSSGGSSSSSSGSSSSSPSPPPPSSHRHHQPPPPQPQQQQQQHHRARSASDSGGSGGSVQSWSGSGSDSEGGAGPYDGGYGINNERPWGGAPPSQVPGGGAYVASPIVANFSPFGGGGGFGGGGDGQNIPPSPQSHVPRSRAVTVASERELETNMAAAVKSSHKSTHDAQPPSSGKYRASTHSPSPHAHATQPLNNNSISHKEHHKHDHSHKHGAKADHAAKHNSPATSPRHGGGAQPAQHHNTGMEQHGHAQPMLSPPPPAHPLNPLPHPPSPHSPTPHTTPQHVALPQHLQPLHQPPKALIPPPSTAPSMIPSALSINSTHRSPPPPPPSVPTVEVTPAPSDAPEEPLLTPPSTETLDRSLKAKLSIERFYLDTLMQERNERVARREMLESKMTDLPPRAKSELRKQLAACETYYLRTKRRPMTARDFITICILGRGAFGEVRLVRKKNTNEIFAMKKLSKADMMKKNQVAHVRAERDILVAAHNNNPWVVKLHYSFQDDDYLYLIMEYLPGGDMMGLLIKHDIFPEDTARFYIVEILLALDSVHQCNYIHRDIKPDNLLLEADGHIKLTDFGLCTGFHKMHSSEFYDRVMADAQLLKLKNIMDKVPNRLRDMTIKHNYKQQQRFLAYSTVGTPDYTAPEVFQQQGYGTECDYWSVGCILYEMIIGYPPFVADSSSETCLKILNCASTLQFPPEAEISLEAKDLIQRLVCDQRTRLGVKGGFEEIKTHPFFRGVVWERFRETHPAPLVPQLAGPEDVSHFDAVEKAPDETQEPPPKPSGVDNRSPRNLAFIGILYNHQ